MHYYASLARVMAAESVLTRTRKLLQRAGLDGKFSYVR